MDCSLTYDEHVTQVTSKCIGSLCQINRVKYLFDRRKLITIINSLVFSKLLYCSSVWAKTTKKNIELLQTVQNFAARIVSTSFPGSLISPPQREREKKDPGSGWSRVLVTNLSSREGSQFIKVLSPLPFVTS